MSDPDVRASLAAEELAARILQFLADDPGRMARFFNTTGLTAETIRTTASAPGFAMSVLDYVLEDEALLKGFAAGAKIRPEEVLRHRAGLERPGESASTANRRAPAPLGAPNMARRLGHSTS
jgi:Protein of unknown function (DUF3572)